MKIIKLSLFIFLSLCASLVNAGQQPELELIMSNTDWMGNAPENPYWADDSRHIYFQKKQNGNELRDWYVLDSESKQIEKLDLEKSLYRDSSTGSYSTDRQYKLTVQNGDVFKKNLNTGNIQRITQTLVKESAPQFVGDSTEIAFWVDNRAVKLGSDGSLVDLVDIQVEKKDDDDAYTFLTAQQQRYFITLKEKKYNKKLVKEREEKANTEMNVVKPFLLDKDLNIEQKLLSPDAHYLILLVTEKSYQEGKKGKMPRYVTDSGYVEIDDVRTRVGENHPSPQSIILLDLKNQKQQRIKIDGLPGIDKDPLKKLRKTAIKWHMKKGATKEQAQALVEAPEVRNVTVWGLQWSKDSNHLAIMFRAIDSKDRWIATLDTETQELTSQHRLTDNGWINWKFNQFGWLPDSENLWLLSEEDGFSHVYLKNIKKGKSRQLTSGKWEVHNPILTRDGKTLYFRANKGHPGIYEIYQLQLESKKLTQLSRLNGNNSFSLSEDESRLLIQHSTITSKPEIYLKEIANNQAARQLTQSMSDEYRAIDWVVPTIEKVPSSKVKQRIYSKLYQPKKLKQNKKYPAVIFVHGAGYTQNSHFGWAYYFHELMFHSYLVNQGYLVLDMDYRGSAGYGRDWRTAIYRNMGHPEVEDLQDGVDFLVENYQVDKEKVGVYGGSYGGFLTFMAMFREPDLFAAGAALRPVTDWATYNHEYTSNILNTPAVDPVAYEVSSPIEFAEGLTKPLLIATGMMDDNVFFQDSVRLVQRLIELKKENFEMAVYPLERHSFKHHTSWLDEYRRIFKLFEANLK